MKWRVHKLNSDRLNFVEHLPRRLSRGEFQFPVLVRISGDSQRFIFCYLYFIPFTNLESADVIGPSSKYSVILESIPCFILNFNKRWTVNWNSYATAGTPGNDPASIPTLTAATSVRKTVSVFVVSDIFSERIEYWLFFYLTIWTIKVWTSRKLVTAGYLQGKNCNKSKWW